MSADGASPDGASPDRASPDRDGATATPQPTALPPVGARVAAFVAVVLSGACGALIGYAVADLQCTGDCTVATGLAAIGSGALAAVGVGIVAVLALRAMGEWKTIRERDGATATATREPGGGVRGRPRVQ